MPFGPREVFHFHPTTRIREPSLYTPPGDAPSSGYSLIPHTHACLYCYNAYRLSENHNAPRTLSVTNTIKSRLLNLIEDNMT